MAMRFPASSYVDGGTLASGAGNNITRADFTNAVQIAVGTTNDRIVEGIAVQAKTTTIASALVFIHDNGANKRAFYELPVPAVTPTGSTCAWGQFLDFNAIGLPHPLKTGEKLWVGKTGGGAADNSFDFTVQGGTY